MQKTLSYISKERDAADTLKGGLTTFPSVQGNIQSDSKIKISGHIFVEEKRIFLTDGTFRRATSGISNS
jgi:hypothetical protein